ncbi:hypothetical protein PUN28_012147 [Cardiocondyla obscurior]|uniref:TRUD domain-containing protein n=1 Tax=Cardiocondyla obscurior TaxID=286306 RepID=A0AAW2FC86_9HYME
MSFNFSEKENRNWSNKRNFNTFNRPLNKDTKKSKLKIGSRLKEYDLGITEYIGKHSGFSAIIKERYTDFHVNEIGPDGEIAKLTNQDIPPYVSDELYIEDLMKMVPSSVCEQLNGLKREEVIKIDVTNIDKDTRKNIHDLAHKMAKVTSQTIDEGNKKLLTIIPNAKFYKENKAFQVRLNNGINWNRNTGYYCHFLLHKVNMDTISVVNQLAALMHVPPNKICYAGTKDRRAWTTQWLSVKRAHPRNILRVGRSIRGAYIGNFKYARNTLQLGMLRGNQFRIALRDVCETDEKIEQTMVSLRDNGFINYYGLQRFGSVPTIPTHEIGKCLLQGKWREAIELILKPRPESNVELTEARQIYAETKDAGAAYAKLRRTDSIEAKVLHGLEILGEQNPLGVLDSIPRNIRLIYIHAYQSFVWNQVVSKRMKEFGTDVVVGDLVYDKQNCQKDEDNEFADYLNDIDDTDDGNDNNEETDSNEAFKGNINDQVKILTEKDLSNYTLADVIMPQPGWKIIYPPYAKAWFDDLLAKDGLTCDLRQKNKKYSLGGTYRNILEIPTNLSWKIMHYENKHDDLILPDLNQMRAQVSPQDKPNGKYKALIIEMCLTSSSYATMALREILKNDTSAETQAALSAARDTENMYSDTDVATSGSTLNEN